MIQNSCFISLVLYWVPNWAWHGWALEATLLWEAAKLDCPLLDSIKQFINSFVECFYDNTSPIIAFHIPTLHRRWSALMSRSIWRQGASISVSVMFVIGWSWLARGESSQTPDTRPWLWHGDQGEGWGPVSHQCQTQCQPEYLDIISADTRDI